MEIIEEKEYIDKEQYYEIKDALDKAQDSDSPFLVVDDNGSELSVVGDANKTEKIVKYYDVIFRLPTFLDFDIENDNTKIIEEKTSGLFSYKKIRFTNVFIAPRHDLDIVEAIAKIMPFFNKLEETGEISSLSDKECLTIIANMNNELLEPMYKTIGLFLGINEDASSFIIKKSLVQTFSELIHDFPAIFNEADIFFG